jgi:hypothetical protein
VARVESATSGRDARTTAEFFWAAGLSTPKQVNFDFAATKDFRLAESQTLQFRVKMFSTPNHVELSNPATGWGDSNVLPQAKFGTVTSTRAGTRQVQFAFKYNF